MNYDQNLWDIYTNDNKSAIQPSRFNFIFNAALILNAKKVCEAGCNVGNNLSAFPKNYDVTGCDMNESAIEKAKKNNSTFKFRVENIKNTSFADNEFDLVFTRGVLIHTPLDEVDDVLKELFRISKRWVFNLEYFGDDGKMIAWKRGNDLLWYRNMKKRWEKFNVEVVSDVDIPLDVDSGKMRFTLVRKL